MNEKELKLVRFAESVRFIWIKHTAILMIQLFIAKTAI